MHDAGFSLTKGWRSGTLCNAHPPGDCSRAGLLGKLHKSDIFLGLFVLEHQFVTACIVTLTKHVLVSPLLAAFVRKAQTLPSIKEVRYTRVNDVSA